MRDILKGLLYGLTVMVLGLALLLAGICINGFTLTPAYTPKNFFADMGAENIVIDADAGGLCIKPYDGDRARLDCYVSELYSVTASNSNGTFTIKADYKQWSNLFGYRMPQSVLYLPKESKTNLQIKMLTGALKIEGGQYGTAEISADASKIEIAGNPAFGSLSIKLRAATLGAQDLKADAFVLAATAGFATVNGLECPDIDINTMLSTAGLRIKGNLYDYTAQISHSAGSCNISSRRGGSVGNKINVNVSAGTVNINFI